MPIPAVDCLCFSKDRPLQLDGYLRSFCCFVCPAMRVTVLYTTSTPKFAEGYEAVRRGHPAVTFVREEEFGEQVLHWLDQVQSERLLFGCDDVVFHRPVCLDTVHRAFREEELLGFSLRLGRNFHFSFADTREIPQPAFQQRTGYLTWEWSGRPLDWGYPFELDGTVYPRDLVSAVCNRLEGLRWQWPGTDWRHPNWLEVAGGSVIKSDGHSSNRMACFPESCLVVPTVNRVQEKYDTPLLGERRTVQELEALRREGYRVDVDAYARRSFDRIHIGDLLLRLEEDEQADRG